LGLAARSPTVAGVYWEPVGDDQIRCRYHKVTFEKGIESCPKCFVDPPPELDHADSVARPEPAPDGCFTSHEHEKRLTETALLIEQQSKKLMRGKGRINYATAFKGFEVALKYLNAAQAYTQTRERRTYVGRLERAARALQRRRGGSN
jgi:hypothetical protein